MPLSPQERRQNAEINERLLIGAVILEPDLAPDTVRKVIPLDMVGEEARRVWESITELVNGGRQPDAPGLLAHGCDSGFVAKCVQQAATGANLELYVERIREHREFRRIRALGHQLLEIESRFGSGGEAATEAAAAWDRYVSDCDDVDGYTDFTEILTMAMEAAERPRRIPAPLNGLDIECDGFPAEGLIVIAGRPGMGKSSLVTSIARRMCLHQPGQPGAIFSLEMERQSVVASMLSAESGVALSRIPSRAREEFRLTDEEYGRLAVAQQDLAGLPIDIIDNPGQTIATVSLDVTRMLRRHRAERPAFIAIDHLGLLNATNGRASQYEKVTEISRDAKLLSRRFRCPVLLLAQLNRGPDGRDDHRPRLSDLRDSGSIEQDADVVLFPFRPSFYDGDADPSDEIIIAKNRAGPTGSAPAMFTPECVRWSD